MNKALTRTLSFILAALITASFIACAAPSTTDEPDNDAQTNAENASTVEETTEKRYLDNLDETLDFGGYTIRMLISEPDSFQSIEEAADVVDAAVYNRNLLIEERLNVNLELVNMDENWGTISTTLTNSVKAGSDDYDMYAGYCYWSIALATSGYMRNLASEPYLDLEREYWGKKFIDAMAYKDYIYWLTGDITLTYTNGMYATFINLAKWSDIYPDENVYQIVRDGKWTLDNLAAHAEGAYNDLNGDSKIDATDSLGFAYSTEDSIDGMALAAGVRFTEFDSEGVPYITILDDPSTAVSFVEKLTNLCTGPASILTTSDGGMSPFTTFSQCNLLSVVGRLWYAPSTLREMADDYAILPAPKLDEAQPNYLTTLHDGTTIIGLPKTITDTARTTVTATLEALAAESYKTLTPTYLDVALKSKYSRDAESAEMIDLIRENIVSDFGFQYTITGFNNFFRGQTKAGDAVASTIAKYQNSWTKVLSRLLEQLEANGTD